MTSYRKESIEAATGKMLTASAVGNEIVNQIFKCKGAQMVIPNSHSFLRTTRAWPGWLLTIVKDRMAPGMDPKKE